MSVRPVGDSAGNTFRSALLVGLACAFGFTSLAAQVENVPKCPNVTPSTATTLGDLLQGKLSGVNVLQSGGGAAGGAKRIRIRGVNSVHGNDPIVFVDNIRVTPLSETGPRGVHSLPLFEFVDPAQITRVEVLRGPTATIQYADAGGGVIRIYTRRGSGGEGTDPSDAQACASQMRKP